MKPYALKDCNNTSFLGYCFLFSYEEWWVINLNLNLNLKSKSKSKSRIKNQESRAKN